MKRTLCPTCKLKQASTTVVAYHGTRTDLPFETFDSSLIGTGIVSSRGREYGGFFFTTEKENAAYYTEYFIAKVKISNVTPSPTETTHPPTAMKQAVKDHAIYLLEDVVDGHIPSDVIVVPASEIHNIEIVDWEFVGDEDTIFDDYDELFGSEGDSPDQDDISDILEMMGKDIDYLMTVPIFRKYYNSR